MNPPLRLRIGIFLQSLLAYIKGQEVVYVKMYKTSTVYVVRTQTWWDPFDTEQEQHVMIGVRLHKLNKDGTITTTHNPPPFNSKGIKFDEVIGKWMYVDMGKRTLMNLKGTNR